MIFANNSMIDYVRNRFKNKPGATSRHKVRAWFQVQMTDINSTQVEEGEHNIKTSFRHLNSMSSFERVVLVVSLVKKEMEKRNIIKEKNDLLNEVV